MLSSAEIKVAAGSVGRKTLHGNNRLRVLRIFSCFEHCCDDKVRIEDTSLGNTCEDEEKNAS